MFKSIFIDADDTIFDFGAAQRNAFYKTFDKLKYPINEEIYSTYNDINIYYWKKFERGEIEKNKLITERFVTLFNKMNFVGDENEVEKWYRIFLGEETVWWEGAQNGIEKLSKKYDLYVTTNGCADTQINRIKKSGLGEYIKDTFISESIGYPKPQPEYYEYCFKHSNAQRENTLAIGDSLTSDIKGGINAGLKTMWCNFMNNPLPDMNIDYVVYSWEDILKIL